MLTLTNVTKRFGTKTVLDSVSLSVCHGEIALLLGPSGVGKSTLLRILNNLEIPDAGFFELDGKPLDLTQVHVTHTVGMVFQQFNVFEHLTVLENITLVLEKVLKKHRSEAQRIAYNLLERYGLRDQAHQSVHALSGGQKQRLAIARALTLHPSVICFDEPTSALDPVLKNYVATLIRELVHQNIIILIASHDINLIYKLSCTVYLMHEGKIIESARSEEFKAHPSLYPALERFTAGINI